MAADANFPFKLGAEVCLDEVMTVLVNVGVRGSPLEWGLGAQLQVLCQMLTAAVGGIILVYCLAPVAGREEDRTRRVRNRRRSRTSSRRATSPWGGA